MANADITQTGPFDPAMTKIITPEGIRVSWQSWGEGPPLVLVHGAFSHQRPGWRYVREALGHHVRCHAISRRGRNATDATSGHGIADESSDIAALLRHIGEPVCLLGHSYGALAALGAASLEPGLVRRLILYEPPRPGLLDAATLAPLDALAAEAKWEELAVRFFNGILRVPMVDLEAVRSTRDWAEVVYDTAASLADLHALAAYRFDPDCFRDLTMPVLLQFGTESPAELYLTETLLGVLHDARRGPLEGQGHDAMVLAPELYVDTLRDFVFDADLANFRLV